MVRPDRWIALALSLVAFLVYGLTLCRTVYTGDDGDFLTAMTTWGIPHPTGYPLFTLLGRLFLELLAPVIAEPALRINILTALCGAAAVGMFYRFAQVLLGNRVWCAAGALLFAFSATFWQQCLSCEVYALTALFLFSCLYLTALWWQEPENNRLLRVLAFIYGLSLTNNMTMAVLLPGFLTLVLVRRKTLLREGKTLLGLIGLFLLPLSLYAYLPIVANNSHSPVLWGEPKDAKRLVEHVSGAQYRGLMFSMTGAEFKGRVSEFVSLYGAQFSWLLLLAPLGLWSLWQEGGRSRAFAGLGVFIGLLLVVYGLGYSIMDVYVYYIPCYAMSALFLAAGGRWLTERFRMRALPVGIVAMALPLLSVGLNWAGSDKSGNYLEADYSENILTSAPKDALVIGGSASTFSLWYQQYVKGKRPDVTVVNPDLLLGTLYHEMPWYRNHVEKQWAGATTILGSASKEQIVSGQLVTDLVNQALKSGKPVLFVADPRSDKLPLGGFPSRDQLMQPFVRAPWGIGERLFLPGTEPPVATVAAENEKIWPQLRLQNLFTGWAFNDSQQRNIPLRYYDALFALGQVSELNGRWAKAQWAYESSLKLFASKKAEEGLSRCQQALASAK
ncbi:MAG: DUF2723 domain-containing protein [Armatimonas sp.]